MQELIQQIVSKLGVNTDQAEGGAGLLMKLVKDKLGGDFAKVDAALPGASSLAQSAPAEGSLGKLAGGLASAFGGGSGAATLASLAGSFGKLGLTPDMIGKFANVIMEFVKGGKGAEIAGLLGKVLKG